MVAHRHLSLVARLSLIIASARIQPTSTPWPRLTLMVMCLLATQPPCQLKLWPIQLHRQYRAALLTTLWDQPKFRSVGQPRRITLVSPDTTSRSEERRVG